MSAQSIAALQTANRRRLGRALVKQQLARRELSLAEALELEDSQCVRVYELLLALPRVGERQMRVILRRAGCASGGVTLAVKQARELTASQRAALIEAADRQPEGEA